MVKTRYAMLLWQSKIGHKQGRVYGAASALPLHPEGRQGGKVGGQEGQLPWVKSKSSPLAKPAHGSLERVGSQGHHCGRS